MRTIELHWRTGHIRLVLFAAATVCLVVSAGCRDSGSPGGNPALDGPQAWPTSSAQVGGPGSGEPGPGGSDPGRGSSDPGRGNGGPGLGSGGGAPGNPGGVGNVGRAPGNPGGSSPDVEARGIPIDLGTYDFNPGTTLAAYVQDHIVKAAVSGCRSHGLPDNCVRVELSEHDDSPLPPCPEKPPTGSGDFPNNGELLANYGESGIDRRLPSNTTDARAFARAGSRPPDIVYVYWTRCAAAGTSGETTTTTTLPPTTTAVPLTTTTTTRAPQPSTVSTTVPEVAPPSATTTRSTTTTESAGG